MRGRKRKKQSVFRQLSLMGIALMLVLFLAFMYSNRRMQMEWRENILNTNQQLMAQVEGKMDEYNQLMTQIATVTAYSPTIYSYFFQDSVERVISSENVNTVFSNTILLEQNIVGIYLYDREMELIASMGKGTQEVERMGIIQGMKSELEYSSLFSFSDSNTPYYAIYFPVFDLNNQLYGQQIGMCVLIMKPDKFMEILEGAQATEHTQIYLLDRNGMVLASQGSPGIGQMEEGWKESSPEYQVASIGLPTGGWQIVSRIPAEELYERGDVLVGFHTGAYLLALILMFLMVAFCYWRLLVPIREMDSFVKSVSTEPGERIYVRREDEIGRVEDSLNQMLDSIEEKNRLIRDARERAYQMEAAEKQLQILAYRNQINPHFLYNTLDCIRAMALYHDEDEIAEITLALAKVFRFAVREGNIVKVEEELNYIREYANIIEHRFRGRIRVVTKADDGARQKPVVKLLLQPLIENAVFHGLEQKIEGGRVKASVGLERGGYLRFIIEDNGCGIEKGKLEALRAQINSICRPEMPGAGIQGGHMLEAGIQGGHMPEAGIQGVRAQEAGIRSRNVPEAGVQFKNGQGAASGIQPENAQDSAIQGATAPGVGADGRQRGIGMANICQRLKLFYGEEALFQIESEEGRGTRIMMRIPDRVEEEMV